MKKIYILFFLLPIGLNIIANPIPLPTIEISELFFEESNNWKLELVYYGVNQGTPIDSIFLYSTTDTMKLPTYEFLQSTGVFVITVDSLDSEFIINRYADTIKVVTYVMGSLFEDLLIFGNIAGATINYPRHGQSISKLYWMCYTKDNSPTIGLPNDTIGTCGTLKGTIYDKYSEPVDTKTFGLDYYFETSENGEYSARVYSKPSKFSRINYRIGQYSTRSVSITEISYIMEPDSVVDMNIYLLDTLETGINDVNIVNTPISVYPNPISKNEELKINIDLPIITSDIQIEIIDLNGKMIKQKKISQNPGSIIVPDKSGFYLVRILLDSDIISSNRIIVNE